MQSTRPSAQSPRHTPARLPALLALLVAAGASLATSPPNEPFVHGSATGEPFTLFDDPAERAFTIVAEASADAFPEGDRYGSLNVFVVLRGVSEGADAGPAEIRITFSGGEDDEDEPRTLGVARGEERQERLYAFRAFAACSSGRACRVQRELRLEHLAGGPIEVEWSADASIPWNEDRPPEGATLVVSIDETR